MEAINIRISLAVLTAVFLSAAACGCGEPETPGGEITVANHILDKEFNQFTVDQITLARGATSYSVTLRPEQTAKLPFKGIRSLRFTRQYKDYSMIYIVECPAGFNKRITMKLIDVHTNRLGGGCELVKRGKREEGAWVKWE